MQRIDRLLEIDHTALLGISLRVACIKMLTTAMGFEEFQKGPNNATRTKIVSVFFKCLYSESSQTIEAANDALKVVLLRRPNCRKIFSRMDCDLFWQIFKIPED